MVSRRLFIFTVRKGSAKHTVGVEFGSRVVKVGGKNIKLQIWDTAGMIQSIGFSQLDSVQNSVNWI